MMGGELSPSNHAAHQCRDDLFDLASMIEAWCDPGLVTQILEGSAPATDREYDLNAGQKRVGHEPKVIKACISP